DSTGRTMGSVLCALMVGRDEELAELKRAWRSTSRVVLVRGAAGIGKSRLVREFADWARAAGGAVVTGRCRPAAADVPFRPLREALLVRLFGTWHEPTPGLLSIARPQAP